MIGYDGGTCDKKKEKMINVRIEVEDYNQIGGDLVRYGHVYTEKMSAELTRWSTSFQVDAIFGVISS
jgi:hypothetical protein